MNSSTVSLPLPGCTPEPLMNYLKALGVFRLVAKQPDPSAKLSWHNGAAVLHSKHDRESLVKFFEEEYCPTPIIAPWNGGSGFYGGGSEPLEAIIASDSSRFQAFRETITAIRAFVPESKPKDDDKQLLLTQCRVHLHDEVLPWLDACFVIGEERIGFFPLLGTGGNDGRLDFTNNFMQRLAEVLPLSKYDPPLEGATDLLANSLFNDTLVTLGKSAIGQFGPGSIGGANATQGKFEADSRVNPWDFILMLEGALLFAGSLARKLGTNQNNKATFPFSVESVAVGYGASSVSEETTDGSRAELWLPIWERPFSLRETQYLFAEGRAQLGRKQAKTAVDFALAINLMGINRGITSFVRYGFLKRNGLAYLATPLAHIPVQSRPQARLLEDYELSLWIDRWRRACNDKERTPQRYQAALRAMDRAYYAFATRSEQGNVQPVLRATGIAEQTLSRGIAFAEANYLRPLQGLHVDWLKQADDHSPEFRLAASLAGIRGTDDVGPLRTHLEETEVDKFDNVSWAKGSTSAVWSQRPLAENLAQVFLRRQLEAFRAGKLGVPLNSSYYACLDDVVSFLRGETDDYKLHDLLWGLTAIDWKKYEWQPPSENNERAVPFEFGVPRLVAQEIAFYERDSKWLCRASRLAKVASADSTHEPPLINSTPEPSVFQSLASGQKDSVSNAVTRAARRLRNSGLTVVGYRNRYQAGKELSVQSNIAPQRLLAAMLFPLANRDLSSLSNFVLHLPENQE